MSPLHEPSPKRVFVVYVPDNLLNSLAVRFVLNPVVSTVEEHLFSTHPLEVKSPSLIEGSFTLERPVLGHMLFTKR